MGHPRKKLLTAKFAKKHGELSLVLDGFSWRALALTGFSVELECAVT
jgi:hypothetical protein